MAQALQTMIENMPIKTGKSLQEWQRVLASMPFEKHAEAVNYLKSAHGVTHGYANTIVTLSKIDETTPYALIENQYQGKALLRPIYNALIEVVTAFGDDVTITPKKGSVSLIRKKQFALIKPATKTRVDLGLKLKGIETQGCLEDSGPFGTMCTHRIQLNSVEDVNNDVKNWLLTAYNGSV